MIVKTAVTLWATAIFLAPGSLRGQDVPLSGEWPTVQRGVWKLESTRVLPNGKKHTWTDTQTACHNPADLFMEYWGLGKLEEAGCRYYASKAAGNQYRVASECMVRGVGKVLSEARIAVSSEDSFEKQVVVNEGKRKYSARQVGRRISECPATKPEPAR